MKTFLSRLLIIKTIKHTLLRLLITACLAQTTACAPNVQPTNSLQADLTVEILYPIQTTEVEMGQSLKSIVKVSDKEGKTVGNAQVTLSFKDSESRLVASIPAAFGSGDVYRSEAWNVPHKTREGIWTLSVEAKTDADQGTVTTAFHVKNSTSETLLYKYGFWADSPSLKGIVPTLTKEQGDAQNGAILWGGTIPTQHLFPESWLEVQWRKGDFNLTSADKVREFILNTLGNAGVYRTRYLESFEQEKFKDWNAWKVKVRGQLSIYDEQWMIFYAPEVDKTYALGTTVALPPSGMDAHDVLREGFEVHPEIQANGIAPQPLLDLLPAVELTGPEIGTRFFGTGEPIILKWKPAKELAQDEYYLVSIDFNYAEGNSRMDYVTRETQFVLPEELYRTPNCGVFNWQVTLIKQTNTTSAGQPEGVPISFNSLYWYVQWFYPLGETAPFNPLCPNQQF
jgi:hypothetical protein